MDKCAYETPHDIHYLKSVYEFVVGIESRTEKPKYENIVTKWRMSGGMELPMGLSLDELSGEISGIPLVESDKRMYRITGENRDGVGSVEIEIMARRGVCKGEGYYREVEVGVSEAVLPAISFASRMIVASSGSAFTITE